MVADIESKGSLGAYWMDGALLPRSIGDWGPRNRPKEIVHGIGPERVGGGEYHVAGLISLEFLGLIGVGHTLGCPRTNLSQRCRIRILAFAL